MKQGLDAEFRSDSEIYAAWTDMSFCFSPEIDEKVHDTIALLFNVYRQNLIGMLQKAHKREEIYELYKCNNNVVEIKNFTGFILDDCQDMSEEEYVLDFTDRMLDTIASIDSHEKLLNFFRQIPLISDELYDEFGKDFAEPASPYLKAASEILYEFKGVIHSEGGYRYSETIR